jgi:hypothetical protein
MPEEEQQIGVKTLNLPTGRDPSLKANESFAITVTRKDTQLTNVSS